MNESIAYSDIFSCKFNDATRNIARLDPDSFQYIRVVEQKLRLTQSRDLRLVLAYYEI